QLPDRANAETIEDLAGHFADSPEAAYRQRIEERLYFAGLYDEKSIRFVDIAGDFGHELIGCNSDRRYQVQIAANALLDLVTNVSCRSKQQLAARNIEKGLIE